MTYLYLLRLYFKIGSLCLAWWMKHNQCKPNHLLHVYSQHLSNYAGKAQKLETIDVNNKRMLVQTEQSAQTSWSYTASKKWKWHQENKEEFKLGREICPCSCTVSLYWQCHPNKTHINLVGNVTGVLNKHIAVGVLNVGAAVKVGNGSLRCYAHDWFVHLFTFQGSVDAPESGRVENVTGIELVLCFVSPSCQ